MQDAGQIQTPQPQSIIWPQKPSAEKTLLYGPGTSSPFPFSAPTGLPTFPLLP